MDTGFAFDEYTVAEILAIPREEWEAKVGEISSLDGLVTSHNIPQYSNFQDGTVRLTNLLFDIGDDGPNYVQVGKYLLGANKREMAYRKYGENHAKLASLYDLVTIVKKDGKTAVFLTDKGRAFRKLDAKQQIEYLWRMSLLIPIVHKIYFGAQKDVLTVLKEYLSESTAKRRLSNVRHILALVKSAAGKGDAGR